MSVQVRVPGPGIPMHEHGSEQTPNLHVPDAVMALPCEHHPPFRRRHRGSYRRVVRDPNGCGQPGVGHSPQRRD
jgi:hypothetical protein